MQKLQCLIHDCLIPTMEDIVVFLGLKEFISYLKGFPVADVVQMHFSHFCRETTIENNKFSRLKLISN